MNILDAITDSNLFAPFLGDLKTWSRWQVALRMLYGLPVTTAADKRLILDCTGRTKCRRNGFDVALFLTGRRSGKSRIAAVIGAFEAVLANRTSALAKGEKGIVLITSPTKSQSRIVRDYLRALFDVPLLAAEVEREDNSGFDLKNNVRVEILSGDWRSVRGYSLIAAIVDEVCFFGYDADSKVRSDTELIRAIQPSLATTKGKLIAISSPYAEKGWSFRQYKKHFGNDTTNTLVWNCPSRTMNPTLPQSVIDEAMQEDAASANAEYMGRFRQDIATFCPRDIITACVVKGRKNLPPHRGIKYYGFVDISGGRNDDAALAIGHRDRHSKKYVVDAIFRYRPPFSPDTVIGRMCDVLRQYRIGRVFGDRYAAEFTSQAFRSRGYRYNLKSKNEFDARGTNKILKAKSQLYLDLLPRLCSRGVELPDDDVMIDQLAALERRTRSGGRDSVDHPQGQHDDVANVVAGVVNAAATNRVRYLGGSGLPSSIARAQANRFAWGNGIVPGGDFNPFQNLGAR